jgi:hypothetical protein
MGASAKTEARLHELALAVINAGTTSPGEWSLRQRSLVRLAREIMVEAGGKEAGDAELHAAEELVCRYLGEHLPAGYEVQLCVSQTEASVDLYGPDGEPIHVDSEAGCSYLRLTCVVANEMSKEGNRDG